MLSTIAYAAEEAGQAAPPNLLQSPIILMVMIFVVFWFLLIRPQTKRQKEHQAMLSNLKKGDKVVTNGGIHGTVVGVADRVVVLRIAENVKIEVAKGCVASLQPTKTEE